MHDPNNDNSLPDNGISLPLDGLHGERAFGASTRFPVITSILVWILLAVAGWGAVALTLRFF